MTPEVREILGERLRVAIIGSAPSRLELKRFSGTLDVDTACDEILAGMMSGETPL